MIDAGRRKTGEEGIRFAAGSEAGGAGRVKVYGAVKEADGVEVVGRVDGEAPGTIHAGAAPGAGPEEAAGGIKFADKGVHGAVG